MEAYLTSPALAAAAAAAAAAASLSLTADRPDTGHHPMLTLLNTASAARLTGVSAGQSAPPRTHKWVSREISDAAAVLWRQRRHQCGTSATRRSSAGRASLNSVIMHGTPAFETSSEKRREQDHLHLSIYI